MHITRLRPRGGIRNNEAIGKAEGVFLARVGLDLHFVPAVAFTVHRVVGAIENECYPVRTRRPEPEGRSSVGTIGTPCVAALGGWFGLGKW